ncbi:MBL fold metallo-hydrolase [Alicyclobacillus cycloheptanicus]|nr:MBL fold metallo-hydrolase [Alicyclobacillus cycloheptanicus]
MRFSVLASGSSGNAVYIESENTRLLLDAGISGRQLQQRLKEAADRQLAELDAVLLTHEHIDHVRGLRQVAKQAEAPIFATEGTWSSISGGLPETTENRWKLVKAGQVLMVGDIQVTPFAVSHDAEEPVAYRFDCAGRALAVVTDLGYMSDHIKSVIAHCQSYVLETNHDVDMLRAGRYPWSVKRRILSDKGHLSNHDAAVALSDLLGTQPVDVYLAHLSEENNQPDLAELTVGSVLREIRTSYLEQVTLHRTSRTAATQIQPL